MDAKIEAAVFQATQKTFSMFNKQLSMDDKSPNASLFKSSLTLANTARIEILPGVQVAYPQMPFI